MAYLQRYLHNIPPEHRDSGAIAFYASLDHIGMQAPSVVASILQELRDQSAHLKLIASENYSSLAVQLAMGNLLTDKYAEGYPRHRFYAGCDNVDTIETEACDELKLLFQCDHAYAQPHSGADANLVAFLAILSERVENPRLAELKKKHLTALSDAEYEELRQITTNQRILGMSLASGGHLTHGFRPNISGKLFQSYSYEVNPKTGLLDYDQIAAQAREVKPLILLAGYSAYPRCIDFARMREIADDVGAVLMADIAHFAGLVAGKVLTGKYDPVFYSDVVTSTTHKTLRGPRGGIVLCKAPFKDAINKGCPLVLGGPLPHVMAAKVVAFKEAQTSAFEQYSHQIVDNARVLADELMKQEVPVLTGGTDNHMVLFDVRGYGLTGRQAETALNAARLTVNRNAIANDPNGPWYTSGIRVGTPALTTLGMGADQMRVVGKAIAHILTHTKAVEGSKAKVTTDRQALEKVHGDVKELLGSFPLYPELDMESCKQRKDNYVTAS